MLSPLLLRRCFIMYFSRRPRSAIDERPQSIFKVNDPIHEFLPFVFPPSLSHFVSIASSTLPWQWQGKGRPAAWVRRLSTRLTSSLTTCHRTSRTLTFTTCSMPLARSPRPRWAGLRQMARLYLLSFHLEETFIHQN